MIKVGFLGAYGTFSEIAVQQYFKNQIYESCNFKDFYSIIKAVEDGSLDYAMLPVENSTTGMIHRTYDLLKDSAIFISGEHHVRIDEHLITLENAKIETIKEVYTHPEVIGQCQQFFMKHPHIKAISMSDTSTSVKYVKECNDPSKAALASYLAAEHYQLSILMNQVQDHQDNFTRFFCITKNESIQKNANKISMFLVVNHEAGALFKVLEVFCKKGINMLKLESRPIKNKIFEYCFYIDFEGSLLDDAMIQAIKEVQDHCIHHKVLGCYKKGEIDL